jgi:hypothetical protein
MINIDNDFRSNKIFHLIKFLSHSDFMRNFILPTHCTVDACAQMVQNVFLSDAQFFLNSIQFRTFDNEYWETFLFSKFLFEDWKT